MTPQKQTPSFPHHANNPHTLEASGLYDETPAVPHTVLVLLNVVNALTQLLLGAVAFCAFSFANYFSYRNTLSVHIYLCVIGYVLLMSQAIMSFHGQAGWAHSLKYPVKKTIHASLQILGSVLALTGCTVRIIDTNEHFNSAHSITGIIAMILTCFSLLGGFMNFLLPGNKSTAVFKTTHLCVGTLTITFAFICLCLGFDDWYRFIYGISNANLAITFTVFALAGILFSALSRTVQRILFQ